MSKCPRCEKDPVSTMYSMFNTEMICLDCIARERLHPRYQEAQDAETQAVKQGNYNFAGIGKPADL